MTTGITQNHWRFHEPDAPNLEYGCKPNEYVYVGLRQELTQGVRPLDDEVVATNRVQAGYFCDYIIDVPVSDGIVHMNDDGRGFWYVPTRGFIGTDKLSYRIINIMNQTSEPGCITFVVDYNQRPERTEIIPVLAKTTILQDGDADYWVETNDERKIKRVRTVMAYNTLPDADYVLVIMGYWLAKYMRYGYSNGSSYSYTVTVAGVVPMTTLNTVRTVDFADFDSLKFEAEIDDETIGMPVGWPDFLPDKTTPIFDIEMHVGICLAPIGDARIGAERSNLLPFVYADFDTYPREISEETRARLSDKSTYFAQLSLEIKRPVLLINGRESIALTRPQKPGRGISVEGLTLDSINDVDKITPVVNQSYFDPYYNSSTINTIRNKYIAYEYLGFSDGTRVISLTFTLADIPMVGGSFALIADIPELTSVFGVQGFDPEFLDRYFDNSFIAGSKMSVDYKGLLVLEVFETPLGPDFKTTKFNITRKFCSNIEYINSLTTCLDSFGNIEIYPIDFSKVRGFAFVPYSNPLKSQVANAKLLSSTYVPITASATNTYPSLSNTTKQVAFYGSTENTIPPAIYYPIELLKWGFTPKIAPDIVLFCTRENEAKITTRWRLIPKPLGFSVPDPDPDDEYLQNICAVHRVDEKDDWELDRMYTDSSSIAIYENLVLNADRLPILHSSAYPDIITISRLSKYDNAGLPTVNTNSTTEFIAVLDVERTDSNITSTHSIEFFTYDAINNLQISTSRILFDSEVDNISIVYAYVSVQNGAVFFQEIQKSVEY